MYIETINNNNMIKEIEFSEDFNTMKKGDIFTRIEDTDLFVYNDEFISEGLTKTTKITISEDIVKNLIDNEIAKDNTIYEKVDELEALTESVIKYNKLLSRLDAKQAEYEKAMEEVESNIINGKYDGELAVDADEALTVYHNLIDFIKKIKA